MDNPEKLATFGTQDSDEDKQTEGQSLNGQSRETGNIWYTRHRTKTNKTEGQSGMDNPEKLATFGTQDTGRRQTKLRGNLWNGQSRETGNIWYTRHRTKTNKTEGQSRMDNPEKLATFVCTQDTGLEDKQN